MKVTADGVTFLVGAGASVPAGLPTLNAITQSVRKDLPHDLLALYDELGTARPPLGWDADPANVEHILSILDALRVTPTPTASISPRDAALLQYEIRQSIWRQLTPHDDIGYLGPLARLAE